MDRGVQVALENKYDAVVDMELALRAKLSGTAGDDSIIQILNLLENEARAIDAMLEAGTDPVKFPTVSAADASALRAAIQGAEDATQPSKSINDLLAASNVLVNTLRAS